jgi:hypothetical protein
LSTTQSIFYSRFNIHHNAIIYISSSNKLFQNINVIQEKGGNHLPVPPVGCLCPVECPIPFASSNTSLVTNQHICILKSHDSSPYIFQESTCSHSSVPHITQSHNAIILITKPIQICKSAAKISKRKLVC